jgi:hypothetical protein
LLAVAQGGIKNQDSIFAHFISFTAVSLPKKEPHRQLGDEAFNIVCRFKTQPLGYRELAPESVGSPDE